MSPVPSTIVRLAAASCLLAGTVTAKPPDFAQATRVQGKVPVSLGGAWFLYAQAEFPGGKSRALAPELLTVSQKSDRDVALHLLDVQLPKSIAEPYKAGNRQTKAWEPTPDDIALLRTQWSKLPPATNKDLHVNDVVYDRVEFTLASPEKYGEAFSAATDPGIDEALKGSLFALEVVEKYRPQPIAPGENIAQVMERRSIYVVRSASDSVLEGKQFTGYVAAGPGVPIPIALNGPFKLYRLAKGAGPSAPAKSKPGPRHPARR
jgi:hypothetical protein